MLLFLLEDEEDRRKFLKLHGAYEKKMYRVAAQILRSNALAEEAVQQSWLQVIQRFEEIRKLPWERLEGYLTVTVKHTSLTLLKKERHMEPFPENWDIPAASPELDEAGRLVELIRAMPEKYREVLELRFVLEYSYQDIARRMGLNPSTVSTLVARGRRILIENLRKEGYCYEGSAV